MSTAAAGESIGMMEGAYFVSRGELLAWVNSLLGLNYTKVEQMANGAAYCQIMDYLYPGKVPLHKVNFAAKFEYEFIRNFKVLQSVFNKLSIQKHIEIEKIVKAKYQDNLEFLQWMKRYFDIHCSGEPYEAEERRTNAIATYNTERGKPADFGAKEVANPSLGSGQPKKTAKSVSQPRSTKPTRTPLVPKQLHSSREDELQKQIAELQLAIDGLEKERDFYFGKLRDIEILCQEHEQDNSPLIEEITKILYATEEDFVAVEEVEAQENVE